MYTGWPLSFHLATFLTMKGRRRLPVSRATVPYPFGLRMKKPPVLSKKERHLERMVHFFLYDYKFERMWKRPNQDVEKLKRYRAILSPDFSMYLEMAPVM